jgi:hypothetical protein
MINAVIFSYKNKNLKKVIDRLINNTKMPISIFVYDQNNINRSETFSDFFYKDKVVYEHVPWDSIKSPVHYKGQTVYQSKSEYFLSISDDTLVTEGWEEALVDFLKNKKAIVSGMGSLLLEKENLFFFKQNRANASGFTESGFVDRNFVFGKTNYLKDVMPHELKYNGEEELMSLFLYDMGIKIFSAPSGLYEDLKARTILTKYVPFSLNHNYNTVVDRYRLADKGFLLLNKINADDLEKLPYQTNDVAYDPNYLVYQNTDGRKFLEDTKGIF